MSFAYMFRGFFISLVLATLALSAVQAQEAPAQVYLNRGNVTNQQVNAVNFVNEGRFTIASEIPWDPQNTINFTNRGTMLGSVGFRLETVAGEFGVRSQAKSFYNAPNARIESQDSGISVVGLGNAANGAIFVPDASFLKINAASVTNRGDLAVGENGVMQLFANDMDLTAGTLMVIDNSTVNFGFATPGFIPANVTETNFFPSSGLFDLAYGIDINTNMNLATIVSPPVGINTPRFNITNTLSGFQSSCQTFISLDNPQFWIRDELISSTNEVIQVIAVQTSDTNINVSASFYPLVLPTGNPQGGYLSPMVEFRVASTNFRTLGIQTNSLYVFDQLGTSTNYVLATNLVDGTLRPAPIVLFRSGPGLGDSGQPPDFRSLPPDIFDSPTFSNRVVTNQYAVYSGEVESVAAKLPALPDVGITNLPGRVEINAKNLTLNNTRVRGEGLISINATNLTGGLSSILDSPRLKMNLTASSSALDLKDMTPDSVERFGGFLQIFAGTWTNLYGVVAPDQTGTNFVTNAVLVNFELTVIDARQLHTREPVLASQLTLASPISVTYEDNLSVSNSLQITTPNLTLAEGSRLFLAKGIGFSYTNVPGLSTFTNLGTLQVNELAQFQKDEASGYDVFVNRGDILAFGTVITAGYVETTGNIVSSNFYTISDSVNGGLGGGTFLFTDCFGIPATLSVAEATEGAISINATTAKIDGGSFQTAGDVEFNGTVFKINNHRAVAGGRMALNVTDVLTDSGDQAGNVWQLNNGVAMGANQPGGDLLGTEIDLNAANLAFIDNFWSGQDRGATVDGFTDNVAIGRLVLRGGTGSQFEFLPGAPGSAMYVDVLQIEGAQAASIQQLTNTVHLGMNIYYGNIESTNGILGAERLNGIFGPNAPFNLIWVPSWAGPNSGVDVPLTENGPVRRFNRALRESPNIDSDGDGLPNLYDPFPFPPEAFGITGITLNGASQAVSFGFTAQAAGTYVIEYTTNLANPSWQPLTQLLQTNTSGGIMSFTDQARAGDPQRYYRVRKAP